MVLSKKSKIIIAVIAVIVFIVGLTLTLVFTLMPGLIAINPVLRDLYRKRFEKVDLCTDRSQGEMVREISPEKPLNLITFYDSHETVVELWDTVPEDIKEISVINYIPGNFFKPDSNGIDNVISFINTCEKEQIPYSVQVINGETHYEWQVPIAWIEQNFCEKEYFYGINAAELYNGEEWRGQMDGDVSLYINSCIRLMAKYGRYFFWTDTNIFGTNGTIVDWIEENEFLYDTLRDCYKNVIMQNKESYGDPSSYSIMKGLYMAKLIGGWGVSTDWWHWQVDGTRGRYDVADANIDSAFEQIFYYPENMQTMSLAFVAMNGGFCFKNEAEYWSVAVKAGDKPYRRTASFEYSILPFLSDVLDGTFKIPTREELLANEKFAVVGGINYDAINYDLDESNLYPDTPLYNIIPLLPSNLKANEKEYFDADNIKLINEKITTDKVRDLINTGVTGNTYFGGFDGNWLYINNVENADMTKEAKISNLKYDRVYDLSVKAAPHTYVHIAENNSGMLFTMNNFRLEKDEMTKSLGADMDPKQAIYDWVSVDESGDVRASMDNLRNTVITFSTEPGCVPEIDVLTDENDGGINCFEVEAMERVEDNTYSVTIRHNGYVSLRVNTGSRNINDIIEKTPVSNYHITEYGELNGIIVSQNKELTYANLADYLSQYDAVIDNYNIYTESGYHAFYREYSLLQSAIKYRNIDSNSILSTIERLESIVLIDMTEQIAYLSKIDTVALDKKSGELYDRLIYSMLSPTKRYDNKDAELVTKKSSQSEEYTAKLQRTKAKEIKSNGDKLNSYINN